MSSKKKFSLVDFFENLTTKQVIWILIIVGFIIYFNSLFNGFVWDDKTYIVLNPEIRNINLSKIFGFNIFNRGAEYRPFSVIYFSLLYFVFNKSYFFYHFIQLIIHLANTTLVFYLFSKYFNKNVALLFSIIFLVHPMNVESVAYIAASGTPLVFLIGILALIVSTNSELTPKRTLIVNLLLLLSLLTRETGFLFFIVIICYRLLFSAKKKFMLIITGFVTIFVYFLLRFFAGVTFQEYKYSYIPILQLNFWERATNFPAILFYYIKTFFYPKVLTIQQNWVVKSISLFNFYYPLLFLSLILIILILVANYIYKVNKKDFKILLFFFVWSVIGLLSHMQIVPLDMTVADRWFYFPMVGLLGILGVIFNNFNLGKANIYKYIFLGVVIFLFSARTIVRNTNWKDAITLYEHDSKIYTNFDMENNLGYEYKSVKKYDRAIVHFEKSINLFPFEGNYSNLAGTYMSSGDLEKAEKYYSKALEADTFTNPPTHSRGIYENLGYVLILKEDYRDAKTIISTGLVKYPDARNLLLQLAIVEYYLNNRDEALITAQKAKLLYPDNLTEHIYSQILKREKIIIQP